MGSDSDEDPLANLSSDDDDEDNNRNTTELAADEFDPLSSMMAPGEVDPFGVNAPLPPAPKKRQSITSISASTAASATPFAAARTPNRKTEYNIKWRTLGDEILKKCVIGGKIKFFMGSLGGDEGVTPQDPRESQQVSLEKTKERLAALESEAGIQKDEKEMTQGEYTSLIEQRVEDIAIAWKRKERVQALKQAITACKMLGDTKVPQFYPSMFILISRVLDKFGELVFHRIKDKHAEATKGMTKPLKEDFDCDDLNIEAKETCRNWFFKIACIRELLPRLYIEMCLLESYRFLAPKSDYQLIVSRLAHIIRGIGDPMVAVYARMYLAHMSCKVIPEEPKAIASTFEDYIITCREFGQDKILSLASAAGLNKYQYRYYHGFALDFVAYCAGKGGETDRDTFDRLLQTYCEHCNYIGVLTNILDHFHPSIWGRRAWKLVGVIEKSKTSKKWATTSDAYVALGRGMILQPPESEKHRLAILNKVWKVVKSEEDLTKYLTACRVYVELLVRHYSEKEVVVLLKDIAKQVQRRMTAENFTLEMRTGLLDDLEGIVEVIVCEADEFGGVLTSPYFLTIMDVFPPEKKMSLCKRLLMSFAQSKHTTSDAVIIHTVFDLARNLHDNIDSLSFDTEKMQIAKLISDFIQKVDFGRDLEHQLNVYVDCRAAFPNLDRVTERLVHSTAKLVMRTYKIVKGNHTRKTGSFVKACLAFCHVTVPSIENIFMRMRLFLLGGQVALQNQCIPQADTMFKEVIKLLPTVPPTLTENRKKKSSESRMKDIICTLLSCLVVAPGHPDPAKGPFYLVKQLLQAIRHSQWQREACRAEMYLHVVAVLAAYDQQNLPYRVKFVQANDELYAGATKYKRDLNLHVKDVINEVFQHITRASSSSFSGDTAVLAMQLYDTVLSFFDVTTTTAAKLKKIHQLVSSNAKGDYVVRRALADAKYKTRCKLNRAPEGSEAQKLLTIIMKDF